MHNQQDSSDILDQLLRETVSDTAQWNNNNQKHDIPVVIVENDQSNHTDSFINNLGNSLGLTIPPPRSRSNSIASSHHSYNAVDDCLSDFGSDYGAMSPFPGSTVVQIPSPWIREINSPSQLSINEPMSSLSQAGGSPHSPYPENGNFGGNIPQIDIQHLDFLDFYNQQYGEMPPASPSFGNINLNSSLSTESMSQMKSPEQTLPIPPSFPQAHSTMTTTLPSGKFWNTVKQNDQTLYQCPWPACNKTFTRPYNLKSHYRGHIGERPYKCTDPDCQSSFTRKHDLKRHMKLHSGDRGFVCPACGKQFSRNDAVSRHLKPSENGKESACALKMEVDELKARLG